MNIVLPRTQMEELSCTNKDNVYNLRSDLKMYKSKYLDSTFIEIIMELNDSTITT